MKTADVHWLAGLLEGEGCFLIVNSWVGGKCYRYSQIAVGMSDRDVIRRIVDLMDCTYVEYQPKPPSVKRLYKAVLSGSRAVWWMRRLLPLMGERRSRKIMQILEFEERRVPTTVSRRASCKKAARGRVRTKEGKFTKRRFAQGQ